MSHTTRFWLVLGVLLAALWPLCAAMAAVGGASGTVQVLEGGEYEEQLPAEPRVQSWLIRQAIAYAHEPDSIEVVLTGDDVDLTGFAATLDPRDWIRNQLHAPKARFVEVRVSTDPTYASAHAYAEGKVFTPASTGTLYGARLETGRLRGRLITIGGLHGSLFTDLDLDVPLWRIPPHEDLPAGGGEPGQALQALTAAVQAADAPAIRGLLGPRLLASFPDDAGFVEKAPQMREQYARDHVVQRGIVHGDSAILLSTAIYRGDSGPVRTLWQRVDGRWRFNGQSFNGTEQPNVPVEPQAFVKVVPDPPKKLAEHPHVRIDNAQFSLGHGRAFVLASGEHLVVLSDRPLPEGLKPPRELATLDWATLTPDPLAGLVLIAVPAGGPEWTLQQVLFRARGAEPDKDPLKGELTRIGDRLYGVITTLRFLANGDVEDGESVLLDLAVGR